MKYKLTENGNIVTKNGKPVVVDDDGKEYAVDAIGANDKIATITAESNDRRKKLGEVTEELTTANATITTLQSKVDGIDDKNKVKIDELTDNINNVWEEKQETWETEKKDLNGQLFQATTGAKFATSKVVRERLILPPSIALNTFGKSFKPDGTAVDKSGNVILSKENPGKPAEFDESLNYLIDEYPEKDAILRSEAGGGGGQNAGGGTGQTVPMTSGEKISAGLKNLTK